MFMVAFDLFSESDLAKTISECVPDLAGSVVYFEFMSIVLARSSDTKLPTLNCLGFNEWSIFLKEAPLTEQNILFLLFRKFRLID